jgi:hypothetical protein
LKVGTLLKKSSSLGLRNMKDGEIMKRFHVVALFVPLFLCAIPLARAVDPPKPNIKLSSASGPVGSKVTITGTNLGSDPKNNTVTFGDVAAEAKTWTDKKIEVTVPAGAKTGDVVVQVKVADVASNDVPFKVTASPAKPLACSKGDPVTLGVLNGKDADALALTLSSVFHGQFVATVCDSKPDSSGDKSVSPPASGGDSSGSSKNTLQVKSFGGTTVKKCSAANVSRCALDGLAVSLDRDNFKGILNSNYVVQVNGFALSLVRAFPHPTPDIDVEAVDNGRRIGIDSPDFLILVPSAAVVGQTSSVKTLAQHVAGLKHDFELLSKYAPPYPAKVCPAGGTIAAESCLAEHTIVLSALNPRDVALHAAGLFPAAYVQPPVRVFPLNHAVALLPPNYVEDPSAATVEQYELYQQNQQQMALIAALQSAPPAASPAASTTPVTTTSTTIKTPLPSSTKVGDSAAQDNANSLAAATASILTTTSTTPAAAGSAPSSPGGTTTPAPGAASPPATPSAASAQPAAPSWGIDNIVRLYDYRDAAGIAAAINGMVSYLPNSRPIVQALSDNGANDMIEILPSAAKQDGYTLGDIERAVSLLDLPRPQLSLQVWSYQISATVKNPVEPAKNRKVKCPKTKRSSQPCREYGEEDDARTALENVNARVDEANRHMTKALEGGMDAIYQEALKKARPIPVCSPVHSPADCDPRARVDDPFFQEDFREYLTMKYHDCVVRDGYCLGYYDALDYPSEGSGHVTNASLGRLLLFLAATNYLEAGRLKGLIIDRMQTALGDRPCVQTHPLCDRKSTPDSSTRYFSRLSDQLDRVAEPGNLRILRAAFLDFFFNYKWTINYPNDFVPYDLRHSAHTLDDLLQPIVNAFNHDIDEYVQDQLDDPNLIPKTSKAGLINQGMVSVATLSGTQAMVSGEVSNYFNITQTPSLSEVAQNLLAPSSSSSTGGAPGLQGLISTNPYVVGGEALASMLAPQRAVAQLARGITLTVTPTSLDTASSAELNVNLLVNEPDGSPQTVNTSTTTQDLLDRVASHVVTDTVRVQSLKLFDLSTLSMEITHPQTPTCVPLADEGGWRVLSYFAAVPFSVPCAVWRSTFGSMPVAGRLFEWPRPPITVDNRSVAIIRAVVVPTAMDLGEALDFETDRVRDPVTNLTESLSSVSQLGWKTRQFHRLMMQCILNSAVPGCPARLSEIPDDLRKPTTN